MSGLHPVFGRPMTPAEYAKEWTINAKDFSSIGLYTWMAEQLGQVATVLEVGCGPGESTLALVKGHRSVVSIEINEDLIHLSAERLQTSGVAVEVVPLTKLAESGHLPAGSVRFVHADIFDKHLLKALPHGYFDSVVCWMIGASPGVIANVFGKKLDDMTGKEMPAYREKIQRRCYEIGNNILVSGGSVQIVDRVMMSSWSEKDALREQLANTHAELAGVGYSVKKEETFFRKLDALGKSAIQHRASTNQPNSGIIAVGSVKAIRV